MLVDAVNSLVSAIDSDRSHNDNNFIYSLLMSVAILLKTFYAAVLNTFTTEGTRKSENTISYNTWINNVVSWIMI